ncbi:MAG: NAD(P)H-hydrate dehydratase [Lachnospiraceae bacterium]|nr:NAD(P)H-hydrate dehydratase [Lachnospiraceae bacterium]
MRYVADAGQMKEIDKRTSEEIGIPPIVLMEKAAERIAGVAAFMLGRAGMPDGVEAYGGQEIEKWEKLGTGHSINGLPAGDNLLSGKRVLVVYGAGGNGGDAVAAARLLKLKGASVCLLAADEKPPGTLTGQELLAARWCGLEPYDFTEYTKTGKRLDFSAYDIILDGIFGIGLLREVRGEYLTLMEGINTSGVPVLCIDIPSGIHAGTGECLGAAVKATVTVTFGEYKVGQLLHPGSYYCGKIFLADAGFVPKLNRRVLTGGQYCYLTYEPGDLLGLLPKRVPRSNKGSYGKVLIYAGSASVTGAAYLAARAAYQCGVGLVKLLSPSGCVDVVRRMLPEALYGVVEKREEADFFRREVAWADAVLAGPGIGTGGDAGENMARLIAAVKAEKKPLVLDADAINLLAAEADMVCAPTGGIQERLSYLAHQLPEYTILTPHPKELSRLTGLAVGEITQHFMDTAKRCTKNNKLIFVLKDAHTLVACGNEIYINRSGCDGMATGGSGDVLAGIIAGLCVGEEAFAAARMGVFLHGLAGEWAQEKYGSRAMLAGDLLDGMRCCLAGE